MLLSQLLKKIEYSGSVYDCEIDHITNDSREARSGSIFVCIKGFATDGHLFARKAYENGCRVFVCEKQPDLLPDDAIVIFVKNSRDALAILSLELYQNPSQELTVIGITGTKGKTTTALMIQQLLNISGIKAGYIGSNGIKFGEYRADAINTTPESHKLQKYMRMMVDAGVRALVMEISSQALKLNRVLGISFDIALFTNFSPDHIGPDEHSDLEDYFLSKKKLFDNFGAHTVIANADDDATERMLADCKANIKYYSTKKKTDYYTIEPIAPYRAENNIGTLFALHHENEQFPCDVPIPGKFNVYNALATVAVADAIGISLKDACKNINQIQVEGRFEIIKTPIGANFVIDYAHNGLSLESALLALREYNPSRLICLFGSVGCRTQVRRAQLGKVAAKNADFSILTSDNPDTEDPMSIIKEIATQYTNPDSCVSIPDRAEAIKYAYSIAKYGDIVLLAGKGHERYQLINGKKVYFCEREILQDIINELELINK